MGHRSIYRRTAAVLVGSLGIAACDAAANGQAFHVDAVALSGEPAPGTSATYTSFGFWQSPGGGQAAYSAAVSDASNGSVATAYYAGSYADSKLVARVGDAASGVEPGLTYGSIFTYISFSDRSGQAAFQATFSGDNVPAGRGSAVYSGPAGSPVIVARQGDAAPGAGSGVTYSGFGGIYATGSDQAVFNAGLAGTSVTSLNNSALFAGPTGAPVLVAREGSPLPGIPAGVVLDSFTMPSRNDGGAIGMWTTLRGTGVTTSNNHAAYVVSASGGPVLIGRNGDPAPGVGAGVTYKSIPEIESINDSGHAATRALLAGSGVTSANDAVIYAGPPGAQTLVAREGDAAKGAGTGVRYAPTTAVYLSHQITNDGRASFESPLTGTGVTSASDSAIFSGPYANVSMIVREGTQAPGTPVGVKFDDFERVLMSSANGGRLAFRAELLGTGVTLANNIGIFSYDPARGVQLIARAGDPFEIGAGNTRVISSFVSGGPTLADDGRVVFAMGFTDGSSGLFTTVIPEPTGIAAGGIAVATGMLRRRRGSAAICRRL